MYRLYCIAFLILSFTPSWSQTKVEKLINTQQLRPAILYWDFGSIETIYPSEDSLGRYWNVIHRSLEPEQETDGYDYYKMDSQTLRPLVSEMNHPGFIHYLIRFEKQQAAIQFKNSEDTVSYHLPLPEFVTPEGPGSPAFWGSLPLASGFELEYDELDRWAGKDKIKGILVRKKLRVTGVETLDIDAKKCPAYKMEVTSTLGSNLTVWVMKEAPHYWLKVIYKLSPDRTMKSAVTRLFLMK